MTARYRLVIALLVGGVVGHVYLDWLLFTGLNVVHLMRGGYGTCDTSWHSKLNSCVEFSASLAWIELILFTGLIAAVVVLLSKWVLAPIRAMADTVSQLGPNNVGMRIRGFSLRDESGRLAGAINSMLDRVADGYDAQRRFAANASHELRTPLATQRALIEVSLGSALTAEQLELLSRQLLETNQRNEALIDGLLVLAETERGLLSRSPQRLDRAVASAIGGLGSFADERAVQIDTELKPVEVNGEQPLLERLATNLIQNALKYNQPGGWVHVAVTDAGTMTVANSGPQVLPEQVNGLFEPFRRASGDRLDHGGGVGLGLTIARSIVTAHGGSIIATANRDGGLIMEVRLPVYR